MKKTLLMIALGTLSVATVANASWYVEGDLGYSKIKTSELDYGKISGSKFSPSLAAGYRAGDWRFALDYTHYGKINYSYVAPNVIGAGNLKVQSIGLSALYDINVDFAVKPFVGARLSHNLIKLDEVSVDTSSTQVVRDSDSEKSTTLGYGVVAGATYNLTKDLSVLGAVEYNHLGKVDSTKIKQYGLKAGIRYEF